ncbi:YceI family protein [Sulfurimonas sp. HSL3-7]|uniref:YceI family protein n=1 Tax=Sulfonitrofixus jiaomeiensis TaxID=3131938 RepID=UPI0031F79521
MMRMIAVLLFTAIIALGNELTVDTKRSSIDFTATEFFFASVDGNFSSFGGTITVEEGKVTAINGEVAVISINTGNARRDDHLLSSDFFYEVKFHTITFRSKAVTQKNVIADVTIKDITKTLNFKIKKIEVGDDGVTIKLTGVVDRTAFDIDNSFMSAIIKDNINVVARLVAH